MRDNRNAESPSIQPGRDGMRSSVPHYKVDLAEPLSIRRNFHLYTNKILQFLARKLLLTPRIRVKLQCLRGVRFADRESVFLGEDVFIDEVFPELVSVGRNVMITEGVMIFTHLYDPSYGSHTMAVKAITIEDDVFIGARSLILNGVTLGRGCVVGAGSLVTHDVPPNSVVAGSPARHVKLRGNLDPRELPSLGNVGTIRDLY